MIVQALTMAVCGAGVYLWLGNRFAGSIKPNEQINSALLAMTLVLAAF